MKFKITSPKKGQIQGVVLAAAGIGLLAVMLFIGVLLGFYSDSEKKLSDRVYYGLSSINYFYATEKNINEFAQIVTEITAKELGEACGGFDCYSWSANNPSYKGLRDKFESELREKITGFPAQIGNGGRISFAPPKIAGLEMDESNVKISLAYHSAYRQTDTFLVNASATKTLEAEKNIRYLLLARIGQRLYGNGTYVRDWGKVFVNWGKFDCNNDGDSGDTGETISAKTKLSDSSLNNCKILDIDFSIDDVDGSGNSKWNSMRTNCYSITNSSDSGINAGKVEGGKIYAQIDSLLEKSLICGIDGTGGLASLNDFVGETSGTASVGTDSNCRTKPSDPKCSREDAVKTTDYVNLESRTSAVLASLKPLVDAGSGTSVEFALTSSKSYETDTSAPVPKTSKCSDYSGSCNGGCTEISNTGDVCSSGAGSITYSCKRYAEWHKYDNSCMEKVWTGMGNWPWRIDITGCFEKKDISIKDNWQNGEYSHLKDNCYGTYTCVWDRCIDCGDCGGACGNYCCLIHGYSMSKSYVYEKSCEYKGNFKFTLTPDITFKITDTAGGKIVKKGTTDFENLYFAVKFKPSEPYVIGG